MAEFHFLRPYWLLSLVPALLIGVGLWKRQDPMSALKAVIDPRLLEHLLVQQQQHRRLEPIHLLLLCWVLAALALSGPAWQKEPSPFSDDEAGLVVVLKVSGTMNATDVQPSRLERAKFKLKDILERRPGAATGLVVYSGSAHIVMPLTRDGRIINAMLQDLTPELMPVDGDALANALDVARYLFERSGVAGSVLVMADSVGPAQVDRVADVQHELPVQFLSLQAASAPVDQGLKAAASKLDAKVEQLSVDQADVEALAKRAQTDYATMVAMDSASQWRDAGYMLLPVLALCLLMWSRRGWVVR